MLHLRSAQLVAVVCLRFTTPFTFAFTVVAFGLPASSVALRLVITGCTVLRSRLILPFRLHGYTFGFRLRCRFAVAVTLRFARFARWLPFGSRLFPFRLRYAFVRWLPGYTRLRLRFASGLPRLRILRSGCSVYRCYTIYHSYAVVPALLPDYSCWILAFTLHVPFTRLPYVPVYPFGYVVVVVPRLVTLPRSYALVTADSLHGYWFALPHVRCRAFGYAAARVRLRV